MPSAASLRAALFIAPLALAACNGGPGGFQQEAGPSALVDVIDDGFADGGPSDDAGGDAGDAGGDGGGADQDGGTP